MKGDRKVNKTVAKEVLYMSEEVEHIRKYIFENTKLIKHLYFDAVFVKN